MSKKTYFDNYRVEVEPPSPYHTDNRDHKRKMSALKDVEESIRRHVDCDSTLCTFDTLHVCEHCDAAWTEDDDDYNGGCCNTDQDIWEKKYEENNI